MSDELKDIFKSFDTDEDGLINHADLL
jgi:calcium-dependent protein kinase